MKFMFAYLIFVALSSTSQSQKDPLVVPGRTVMIHLFEWKWTDIASECERFLGPKGYAGVQVSPPNEHANIDSPYRPWWQRYQPVSYKLQSRSGNEQQFKDMVQRCNAVGVRIYVDAVINHMSASTGIGSGGSNFSAWNETFPAVPYGSNDFNDKICQTNSSNIENYNDANQVRNCKLVGLPDLALGTDYVRKKIIDYLNYCINIGVAGFRIDAAKHMWPSDLQVIYGKVKNVRADIFGANKRPFIYQEVIDLDYGEPIKNTDYTGLGRVTEFKYGMHLSNVVEKRFSQLMQFMKNCGTGWGMIPDNDSLIFVDNHDNQRGHGGGGEILTYKKLRSYKIANAFMMAWPYGFVQIMSSYDFPMTDDSQGPPSNGPNTKDVIIYSNDTCGNGWICEHRWLQIYNMAKFRNVANGQPMKNWWDNSYNQIAFSRGNKAFIAINNDQSNMQVTLQSGLPWGLYCDVISGNMIDGKCTGKTILVNSDGTVRPNIKSTDADPMIAIHAESKL